jgi:hypothetical protein
MPDEISSGDDRCGNNKKLSPLVQMIAPEEGLFDKLLESANPTVLTVDPFRRLKTQLAKAYEFEFVSGFAKITPPE